MKTGLVTLKAARENLLGILPQNCKNSNWICVTTKCILKLQPYVILFFFPVADKIAQKAVPSLPYKPLTALFPSQPPSTILGLHRTWISKMIWLQNSQRFTAGGSLGEDRREETDEVKVYFSSRSLQGSNSQQSLKNHRGGRTGTWHGRNMWLGWERLQVALMSQ